VDSFAGPDDPAAARIADDYAGRDLLDLFGLQNGTAYHYRVFYRAAGGAWLDTQHAAVATPAATYGGDGMDPADFVRDRIQAGINVEVQRGVLRPGANSNGRIEVLSAPFAMADKAQFPCVSVHEDASEPEVHALGNVLMPDEHLTGGGWQENQGWLSRYRIAVVGASANPIERGILHRALARIVKANLGIFYARGFDLVDFGQAMHEDTERNVPLYFSVGTFSCLAPSWITELVSEIEAVDVEWVHPNTGAWNGNP
jgi:hypothetical protein